MSTNNSAAATTPANNTEEKEYIVTSEAEADAARAAGITLYNKGEYEGSLAPLVAVLQYYTKKHGETNYRCGLAYLDYGLSLLSIIQCRGKTLDDAALSNVDEEDAETCFMNLDAARVCIEKTPNGEEDAAVQSRLAEIHDSLAQLALETDNSDAALAEFEAELLILKHLPDEAAKESINNKRAIISTMFNIARCYVGEADYKNAVEKLQACVEYAKALPEGTLEAELVEEMEQYLTDAIDNRDNKTFEKVHKSIQEIFPAADKEVPTPEEAAKITVPRSALVTELPGGAEENNSSISQRLAPSPYVLAQLNNHENSNSTSSRSVLPRVGSGNVSASASMGASASVSNGPVNTVTVRKKPKNNNNTTTSTTTGAAATTTSGNAATTSSNEEPAAKKLRTE